MRSSHSPQSTGVNKRRRKSALPITDFSVTPEVTAKHGIQRLAFKVAQAAVALGVDRGAVYDLIKTGRLRYQRLAGGTIIIPKSALDDYLNGFAA